MLSDYLKSKQGDAYRLLSNSIAKLIKIRHTYGFYKDALEVDKQYYFSTLEGLDALLIPIVNVPNLNKSSEISEQEHLINNILKDDISYITSFYNTSTDNYKLQGLPYFCSQPLRHQTGPSEPFRNIECASFTISVLANYVAYCRLNGLKLGIDFAKIKIIIKENADYIKKCKFSSGWGWLKNPQNNHPWPTWSILDTFEELTSNTQITDLHYIAKGTKTVATNFLKDFTGESRTKTFNNYWKKHVTINPPNFKYAMDCIRLATVSLPFCSAENLQKISDTIIPWINSFLISPHKRSIIAYQDTISDKSCQIEDASFHQTLLRFLVSLSKTRILKLPTLSNDDQTEAIIKFIEETLTNCAHSIITQGEYTSLWGPTDNSTSPPRFELYFTERMIEALVEFFSTLQTEQQTDPKAHIVTKKIFQDKP